MACAVEPFFERTDVFVSDENGYHTYRIPAIVVTTQGTLLAFCEGRKTSRNDHGDVDLMLRRSTDGGRTWGPMQLVYEEGGTAKITIGNPCPVIDQHTGTIWLPFCRDNYDVFITHSVDDGQSWANPTKITKTVSKPSWRWYATGPGHGIQLKSGRLIIPCDHSPQPKGSPTRGKEAHSHVFYSGDHCKTWKLGGITDASMHECEVVELFDGSLLLSMRNYIGLERRAFATSSDGGQSWSKPRHHSDVYCPVCQASIVRYSLQPAAATNQLLHSGPGGPGRNNMTVRLSRDEGKTWSVAKVIHKGPAAYSDLVVLPGGTVGCLYERGDKHPYERVTFDRIPVEWLTDGNLK
jgi:sialidase-1